jgi:hypothetical protein
VTNARHTRAIMRSMLLSANQSAPPATGYPTDGGPGGCGANERCAG